MVHEPRLVADGFSFLEGPRWHDGRLYVSDFYTHRVLAFDPRGQVETVCTVLKQPSGLGFLPDGSLLVISMLDRRLLHLDGGRLVEVVDLTPLAPWHCNDMVVDAAGRAYVGNFGFDDSADGKMQVTNLICVDTDGSTRIAASDLLFPNGMVITPEGRQMLVAETFAARISAFDIGQDGGLANRRTWASFGARVEETVAAAIGSQAPLPDGMAMDAEGALWIGDAAGTGALRVREGGEILDFVPTGDLAVYAVALGGRDRRTLYLCAAPPLPHGRPKTELRAVLLSCPVQAPGAGLP